MKQLQTALKETNATIENGVLLVSVNGGDFQPINQVENGHSSYERLHFKIRRRLQNIKLIKAVVYGEQLLSSLEKIQVLNIIETAKEIYEEMQYGLQMGDYVEFTHFGDIVKGFLEETYYRRTVETQTVTNIEKNQFSFKGCSEHYVLKEISLKHISETLLTHKSTELPNELLLRIEEASSFIVIAEKELQARLKYCFGDILNSFGKNHIVIAVRSSNFYTNAFEHQYLTLDTSLKTINERFKDSYIAKKLQIEDIVCEGNLDAIATDEALKRRYERLKENFLQEYRHEEFSLISKKQFLEIGKALYSNSVKNIAS